MAKRKAITISLFIGLIIIFSPLPVSHAASLFNSFQSGLEQEIGLTTYQSLMKQKRVAELSETETRRVNEIFERLVVHAERKELTYNLTVVADPAVNAFAVPGGYIFLNTGLLSFAKSDGAIAGVLGHEIAHVEKKHSMNSIYRSVGMTVVVSLALHKNDSKYKKTLEALSAVTISLVELGYSRAAEFEADEYGTQLMMKAGYNKEELLDFWRQMASENDGGESSGLLKLLSTHPPTSERIERLEAL